MDKIYWLFDVAIHLNKYLDILVTEYGLWIYSIIFLIILLETGLVVTPLLPGDSLLFAAGALAWNGKLSLPIIIILCIVAAILGDAMNYWIGRFLGEKLLTKYPKIIKPKYIEKTKEFYEHYGNKTIILCRFVPIVRSIAPFLAGAGEMTYSRFTKYNIIGGIIWVLFFTILGFLFANIPIVEENFSIVILIIIAISYLPILFEIYKNHKKSKVE